MQKPASQMNASPAGRRLIQRLEGLRLTAYLDTAGVPTIGWGTPDRAWSRGSR